MKLTGIKTEAVTAGAYELTELVDKYVPDMPPGAVLAVTAKVVSLCEGRVVPVGSVPKAELVRREAEYYLPPEFNPFEVMVTIKRDVLIAFAGVDESNGDGQYVLWPQDPQASANRLREHLRRRFGHPVGVVITDSKTSPLRWGTQGFGLAHSGFAALNSYIGQPDIFGKYELQHTYAGVVDGLAAAAVLVMGEGAERLPLVLIEDAGMVDVQDRNPTAAELEQMRITLDEDLYGEMLKKIPWDKRPENS